MILRCVIILGVFILQGSVLGQVNTPPEFLPGGDMDRFSVREDTPKGSSVYTLRAVDPEDTNITYAVSSEYFSVDGESGVVYLTRQLDREDRRIIEATISATDEGIFGQEPSTTSIKREISVMDFNDNPPEFKNLPYIFTVKENVPVESVLYNDILVVDPDFGQNAEMHLSCNRERTPESCDKFFIKMEKMDDGIYRGIVSLVQQLDYEIQQTHVIAVLAEDQGTGIRNDAAAIIIADVLDEQDRPPFFLHAPYSVDVKEESFQEADVLTLKVQDGDRGNPRPLFLSLENDERGYFRIGRIENDTQGLYTVTISTTTTVIDREEPEILKNDGIYTFKIRAAEIEGDASEEASSTADVQVRILDINDNPPQFDQAEIRVRIPENLAESLPLPGIYLHVSDIDSISNAQFNLSVEHVSGSDGQFAVEPKFGSGVNFPIGIGIANSSLLDYETAESRVTVFNIVATDNNGLSNFVVVIVSLEDVNDNVPVFDKGIYTVTIPTDQNSSEVISVINATDVDSDLFGPLAYSLLGPASERFALDSATGELRLRNCENETCVTNGDRFSLAVKATDAGGLSSFVGLIASVNASSSLQKNGSEVDGKQAADETEAPVPKLHFSNAFYNVSIRETTKEGTVVAALTTLGEESFHAPVRHFILSGAKENFIIDPVEGVVTVAPGAVLDVEVSGDRYNIVVMAVKDLTPEPFTATTEVNIRIEDVNNKPPRFLENFVIKYIPEDTLVGVEVPLVAARDPDKGANLRYTLVGSVDVKDKNGNRSSSTALYNNAFVVNKATGSLVLEMPLSYELASVLSFSVKVEDVAAQTPSQTDTADVVLVVMANQAQSFSASWALPKPYLELTIPEEIGIGTTLLTLLMGSPEGSGIVFEKLPGSDPESIFFVHPNNGAVKVLQRIDYELLPQPKQLSLQLVITATGVEIGNTTVVFSVTDLNDNAPVFSEKEYGFSLLESSHGGENVLTVEATDNDAVESGFGDVTYSMELEELFTIDKNEGAISLKKGVKLDRENLDTYRFKVIASDNPTDSKNQRKTSVWVTAHILDVNDNSPAFSGTPYSIMVSESAAVDKPIVNIRATDPDADENGRVSYSVVSADGVADYFHLDPETGDVSISRPLSGKGRIAPYQLVVRAADRGDPQRFTDGTVVVTVSDLSSRSDMPHFVYPKAGEVVHLKENQKIDTFVYQPELSDHNSPVGESGHTTFSLMDRGYGGSQERAFQIDSHTGLISTRIRLDREKIMNYTLVIAASRPGPPQQHSYQSLMVVVTDLNDNIPYFPRPKNSQPLEMSVLEETAPGTVVGEVQAVDADLGDNVVIRYAIVDGNEYNLFWMNSTENNSGIIYTQGRIDNELKTFYDLTIQAYNPSGKDNNSEGKKNKQPSKAKYDPSDLSQVRVHVKVIDVDDNPTLFTAENVSVAVRMTVPEYTVVTTVQAKDADNTDNPVRYRITNCVFRQEESDDESSAMGSFTMDEESGVLRTAHSLMAYEGGYFNLMVVAYSAARPTSIAQMDLKESCSFQWHLCQATIKLSNPLSSSWFSLFVILFIQIQVLQDSEMLKFVFQKPPSEVSRSLGNIHRDFKSAVSLSQPVTLNLADARYYSEDGITDFDSTSLCFQLSGPELPFDVNEAQSYLDGTSNPNLLRFYNSYNISDIGPCEPLRTPYRMTWIEIFVLVIAALIAVTTFVAIIILYCLYRRYQENSPTYYHTMRSVSEMQAPIYMSKESQRIYQWQEQTKRKTGGPSRSSYA